LSFRQADFLIKISPAVSMLAAWALISVMAGIAVFKSSLWHVQQYLLLVILICWVYWGIRRYGLLTSPNAVIGLGIQQRNRFEVCYRDGTCHQFLPVEAYCSWLLISLKGSVKGRECYLVLPRDALTADDYRRLKVTLYCHTSRSAGGV
jgi:hypothetical protein